MAARSATKRRSERSSKSRKMPKWGGVAKFRVTHSSAKAWRLRTTFSSATAEGGLQTESDWRVEATIIKRGASIGSGATVLSKVVVGENSIVGAGSVVTRDVPPNVIVAGNPAKILRSIPSEARTKK